MSIGTIAHSGSYSLHIQRGQVSGASLASCVLQTKQSSIFSTTPMYFRAWVYMTAFSGSAATESIITVQSSANGSATGTMGVGSNGLYITQVANSGANDYAHTTTSTLALNAWTCIELEIDTNYAAHANGLLAAWDDASGTADPQLGGTAELQPLVSATFGLTFYGPSMATDLYIDDVAISNSFVPCSE